MLTISRSVQVSFVLRKFSVQPPKVAVIGSGNFGSTMARRLALNLEEQYPHHTMEIKMFVYQEVVDGKLLTDIINHERVNTKYLPNVILPKAIKACSDVVETCRDADILIFIVTQQHLKSTLESMKGKVKSSAIGVSLIKGVDFSGDRPQLLSEQIRTTLGLQNIAVMMGANIASDIAYDKYVEATVASHDPVVRREVAKLFNHALFRTQQSADVATVEYCGALKNIVALGAGEFFLFD